MKTIQSAVDYLGKTIKELDPAIDLDMLMLRALFEDTILDNAAKRGINLDEAWSDTHWSAIEAFLQKHIDDYSAFMKQSAQDFLEEYKNSMDTD